MILDKELVRRLATDGNRVDGRNITDARDLKIETNIVKMADGSAKITLGDTIVIAGVKMNIGTPFPDTPDEGVLMVAAEFLPLASPTFESGPPREDPVELARVVDRAIRESKCLDVKKLCITPEEKVWMVSVDIDIINDGGNLIDASSIAAAVSLLEAKMPQLDEDQKVLHGKKSEEKLPLTGIPLCTTFAKIGKFTFLDPSLGEYASLDARLTIGTINTDENDKLKLCSMQKNGTEGFTVEEIYESIETAEVASQKIRQSILSVVQ